jgi:hypothetical protein
MLLLTSILGDAAEWRLSAPTRAPIHGVVLRRSEPKTCASGGDDRSRPGHLRMFVERQALTITPQSDHVLDQGEEDQEAGEQEEQAHQHSEEGHVGIRPADPMEKRRRRRARRSTPISANGMATQVSRFCSSGTRLTGARYVPVVGKLDRRRTIRTARCHNDPAPRRPPARMH